MFSRHQEIIRKLKGGVKMICNKKPKMILFDVGGTLFNEGKFSAADGLKAVRLSAINPDVTDDSTLLSLWNDFEDKVKAAFPKPENCSFELPLSSILKYVTHNAGLKFNKSFSELEEIFDRYNSERTVFDGVPELLASLKEQGIRTAVISNNAMSGEGLSLALKRWIPCESFEFVLTSADFIFPKPSAELFVSASNSACLFPSECWYCGDSLNADINGALNAGMHAVYFNIKADKKIKISADERQREYLEVNSWAALKSCLLSL